MNMLPPRILGIDLGTRHVGLALWEAGFIQRLETLQFANWEKLIKEIDIICKNYDVETILVGLPSRGEMVTVVQKFTKLMQQTGRIVETQDEHKTSVHARSLAYVSGKKLHQDASLEHGLAACILLEDYIAGKTSAHVENSK